MGQALELSTLEDHLVIDPETGEIMEEIRNLETVDLPLIARQMSSIQFEVDRIETFRNQEAERILAIGLAKIVQLEKQYNFFQGKAHLLFDISEERKRLEYPGLGVFRYRKMRERIDATVYDAMTDDEKLHVQNERKGCFIKKTTITPDKKAIKAQLELVAKGESEVDVDGFRIVCSPDKFEFVPER